ncbi:hypothetical protein BFP75_02585 [Maribacter sp. 4G9]|nr:hypothetical protein BFP75_02585 [Maribacter sp. 4G9]
MTVCHHILGTLEHIIGKLMKIHGRLNRNRMKILITTHCISNIYDFTAIKHLKLQLSATFIALRVFLQIKIISMTALQAYLMPE